jgi:putative FmdB family regulatory protein
MFDRPCALRYNELKRFVLYYTLNLWRIFSVPTYVYACQTCGAQFEQFQRFSDEPLTVCVRCQGTVRRVFQPVGIVFKGGGWYVTDSRSNNSASATSSTTSSNGDSKIASADGETTKKEATPAASDTPAKSEPAPSASSDSKPA